MLVSLSKQAHTLLKQNGNLEYKYQYMYRYRYMYWYYTVYRYSTVYRFPSIKILVRY